MNKKDVVNQAIEVNKLFRDSGLSSVFMKTFLWHNTIPTDFDILFENIVEFQRAERILKEEGYELEYDIDKTLATKEGKMKLDLHHAFSQSGVVFVDNIETREVGVDGHTLLIPSAVDDFLINCAHCVFGKRDIESHDLEYLKQFYPCSEQFVISALRRADQYGWCWALSKFMVYLENNNFKHNNYRKYKTLYLLPFGLLRKCIHDGIRKGTWNLSRILWWKVVKEHVGWVK